VGAWGEGPFDNDAAACMVAARLDPGALDVNPDTVDTAAEGGEIGAWLATAPFEVTGDLRDLARVAVERAVALDGHAYAERVTAALTPYRAALER
jgi:hypothetical protein